MVECVSMDIQDILHGGGPPRWRLGSPQLGREPWALRSGAERRTDRIMPAAIISSCDDCAWDAEYHNQGSDQREGSGRVYKRPSFKNILC